MKWIILAYICRFRHFEYNTQASIIGVYIQLYIRDHRGKSKLFTRETRHNHKFLGSCELKAPYYSFNEKTTSKMQRSYRLRYGKPNVAIFNSFNFISSFVFCIQLCVQYSTCIQHSTRYSIFNFPFNIQLFILYSILHSPIQLSVQQFQLFIQHSTLIIKTFNYSFNIQLFIQHSTIRFNSINHWRRGPWERVLLSWAFTVSGQ